MESKKILTEFINNFANSNPKLEVKFVSREIELFDDKDKRTPHWFAEVKINNQVIFRDSKEVDERFSLKDAEDAVLFGLLQTIISYSLFEAYEKYK
jgi:hypothetical protein